MAERAQSVLRAQPSATTMNRIAAGAAIVALAARVEIIHGVTIGFIVCILLAPLWLRVLAKYSGAWTLLIVGLVAIASGLWLTEFSSVDHAVSLSVMLRNSSLVGEIVFGAGVIMWARTLMSDHSVGLLFGLGLLASVSPSSPLFATNPWKFGFSVAVTVIVLALAQRIGKRWLEVVLLAALVVISAVTDGRSSFGIVLIALVLVAWQSRPSSLSRPRSAVAIASGGAGLILAVYALGQALILDGYLGEATQQRTAEQVNAAGSIIVGGRPEIAATLALMRDSPWGFGSGTQPSLSDILAAKSGMADINYAPNNGYVERYMFGSQFELHSIAGNLWAAFGLAGIALAAVMIVLVVRGMSVGIATSAASGLFLFVALKTLWNLPFSPLSSSAPLLILALGLAMTARGTPTLADATPRIERSPKRRPRRPV
ncbi:hypothetical protein [Marisediminicola sp. LYQ134]|uniref:hypothetical protein n=1 Tax=Marisediminicola sp. LYQ134 TaxID=3391061 RepID=UPI0039830FB2